MHYISYDHLDGIRLKKKKKRPYPLQCKVNVSKVRFRVLKSIIIILVLFLPYKAFYFNKVYSWKICKLHLFCCHTLRTYELQTCNVNIMQP